MALGSLVVSLGLDAATFTAGLDKAQYQAKQFADSIGRNVDAGVNLAIGSLAAIGAAGTAAFAFLNSQAESIANFQDLSDKIGDTAENIASLKAASEISGVGFDTIAAASIKLTSSLSKLDDEGKGAGAAVKALGLDFDKFKGQAPVDQIEMLAKAFAGFEDGASKTAVAVALFGKSGADMLPLFQDLVDGAERQVSLTAEQIEAADAFTKQTSRLRSELDNLAKQSASELIPALSNIVTMISNVITYVKESEVGFTVLKAAMAAVTTVVQTLVVVGSDVAFVLKSIGNEIGGVAAQVAALMRLDFKGFSAIGDAMKEDATRARAELDKFQASILNAPAPKLAAPETTVTRPKLNTSGLVTGGGAKDDPAKNQLDNLLKAYEASAKEEEDILKSRNRMLELYNNENLISTNDFFAGKRISQEEAVAAQAALFDKEIQAVKAYQAKVDKASERESAQGKINDLTEKKAKLYRDAGQAALEMGFAESKALRGLTDQIDAVNADVLELTGNFLAAANIRLDSQTKDLSARLTLNGDSDALAQLETFKRLRIAQAAYGQQTENISQIQQTLRLQEERIGLDRELGASSELESLLRLRDARSAAVQQMRAFADAQAAIAKASGNPALVRAAEEAKLSYERLAATADPLANKFNTLFSEGLGNAFGDFITGTKSASDAFKSFASSVINQLTRMAAEAATKQIFGSLLGAGGTSGSAGGLLSNLFSGLFGKATGGNIPPNSLQRVNENGPELLDYRGKQYLMNGSSNAQITPNGKLGGGSGGGVELNIQNNVGAATAEVQQTPTADGGMRIDVILNALKASVADDMTNRRGVIGRAMSNGSRAR